MNATPLSVEALRAAVSAIGFELVDAELSGPAARRIVKLRIDHVGGSAPGQGVTSGECQLVSRELDAHFEVFGVASSVGALEVSSPGIERPLRFVEHWRRFVGHDVRVKAPGVASNAVARIAAVPNDTHVELQVGSDTTLVPLDSIKSATLVVDWSTLGSTG